MKMNHYKLLTPGPLTTTDTVKQEMMVDHCTWDDEYKCITQKIRKELLDLAHVTEPEYTAVLMQGSGTFGVESVISSVVGEKDKILIATNGAYGERIVDMAKYHKITYIQYEVPYNEIPDAEKIEEYLNGDPSITHVAIVHSETTSGILNDIESVGKVCKNYGVTYIVDGMSSFGGVDIPVKDWGIDFIISSSNKCIQGVPGFSFIIAGREKLESCKGRARSLSLDLYDQWKGMEKDGKWRFTSPTHVVLAFSKALEELREEGGIPARHARYSHNNRLLIEKMAELGIRSYIDEKYQSPIITTFLYPEQGFSFDKMYRYIKERGYAIYPGKLTEMDTFRIGNIGEIYEEDIIKLSEIFKDFFGEAEHEA